MLNFFITWILAAIALSITAFIVPGVAISNWQAAAVAAIVMGLVNAIVKPILTILTLPITLLTLGLFLLVVNAISLSLVGFITPGLTISGFWPALFGAIVLSLVSSLISSFVNRDEVDRQR
ncbi:MAG: phage holin family protein [Oscillatoriales cyanobacterium RM1_1_9]|nr:phage holin family protein [Oscillatoriales cyanobacterium SM2_3_0]NJO47977.1 phage holin family protein [Oscillatoriales cyanobacterium RM2_1_1]NJO71003.1 phage holin family protein [Oscillatoriales cyanobacterium RM1_1_9]